MKDRTLVLGSGVSALAYLYYNPGAFALAGDQVGGLFASAQNLGPQYVWKTESTTKLLRDMGYIDSPIQPPSAATRVIRIGYWWRGKVSRLEELSDSDRREVQRLYSLKTRGTEPKDSHMSDGKSEFEIWDLPVDQLVADLMKRVELRLIHQKALRVDPYRKLVYTGTGVYDFMDYDTLVSTVPAPVLLKLIGKEESAKNLLAFDKVYDRSQAETEVEEQFAIMNRGFADERVDYVYVPGGEFQFHRVRYIKEGDGAPEFVREYTVKDPELLKEFPKEALVQKRGQIIGGHEILSSLPKNIELLGRYAEWRHGIRLEDVLEALQ